MSYSKTLFEIFKKYKTSMLISNLDTKFSFYEMEDALVMATITDEVSKNCYVASPYALLIDYGEDELVKIKSPLQKSFYFLLIKSFAHFLRFTQIDKGQILNNFLFATNFFSKSWERIDISALEKTAKASYPKHALVIRSVNKVQNPNLYDRLCKNGWKAIVVRQVYIYDDKKKWQMSRNTINDRKLQNSNKFSFVEADVDSYEDFQTAQRLYNRLYLDKHSMHNIHYEAKFFQVLVKEKLLKMVFLRDNESMCYVGVVGMTHLDGVITVPIIGYDMCYSQKDAIYRRLVFYATSYAFEKSCLLNFSSGAPDFKSKRGAKACLEYMFVKDKHLSFKRRIAWQSIYLLSKYFYAPMLKKLKL